MIQNTWDIIIWVSFLCLPLQISLECTVCDKAPMNPPEVHWIKDFGLKNTHNTAKGYTKITFA